MTAAELGFVAAICADPADDTARLVYADWLQENGRPERAEFIRVQVELAAIPNPPAEPPSPPTRPEHHDQLLDFLEWCSRWRTPYYALRRRERELWESQDAAGRWLVLCDAFGGRIVHQTLKTDGIAGAVSPDFDPVVIFNRGFVSRLTCAAEDWLAHADALHWHPGQTVECPTKGCDGGVVGRPKPDSIGGQWLGRMCDTCDGTGTVPRPCPATAQPLEQVTLTTAPFVNGHTEWGLTVSHPTDRSKFTADRWPGIEFVLPELLPALG